MSPSAAPSSSAISPKTELAKDGPVKVPLPPSKVADENFKLTGTVDKSSVPLDETDKDAIDEFSDELGKMNMKSSSRVSEYSRDELLSVAEQLLSVDLTKSSTASDGTDRVPLDEAADHPGEQTTTPSPHIIKSSVAYSPKFSDGLTKSSDDLGPPFSVAPLHTPPAITPSNVPSDVPATDATTSIRLPPAPLTTIHPHFSLANDLLQASPYLEPSHLAPLLSLAPPLRSMAKALTHMDAVTPRYATTPYIEAFNWDVVVAALRNIHSGFPKTSFFCIVFRSKIKRSASRLNLAAFDKAAHEEAVASGGLLKYWFGTPDDEGYNLATCVWREREDARKGGAGPGHGAAMMAVRGHYEKWGVERIRLVVEEGAKGWKMMRWKEDDDE